MIIKRSMPLSIRHFYQYLSLHSLIIGLFPVLLPTFLWMAGYNLSQISLFIALSGLSYVIALWGLERLQNALSFRAISIFSFILQGLLYSVVLFKEYVFFFYLLSIVNGITGCFFWIIQRELFFKTLSIDNTGQKYGNFQIIVLILLNIGIAIGSFLLEKLNFHGLFLICIILVSSSIFIYSIQQKLPLLNVRKPLNLKNILTFKDNHRSTIIFAIDGVFLYFESYFWIISLFLVAKESFLLLGIWVISLAAILALVFYLIKNIIDKLNNQILYIAGVFLYACSWFGRSFLNDINGLHHLFYLLISITFATSFFRLAFNRQFFLIAQKNNDNIYLFIKSYWSQTFIFIIFLIIATLFFVFQGNIQAQTTLTTSYLIAGFISLSYFFYRPA